MTVKTNLYSAIYSRPRRASWRRKPENLENLVSLLSQLLTLEPSDPEISLTVLVSLLAWVLLTFALLESRTSSALLLPSPLSAISPSPSKTASQLLLLQKASAVRGLESTDIAKFQHKRNHKGCRELCPPKLLYWVPCGKFTSFGFRRSFSFFHSATLRGCALEPTKAIRVFNSKQLSQTSSSALTFFYKNIVQKFTFGSRLKTPFCVQLLRSESSMKLIVQNPNVHAN